MSFNFDRQIQIYILFIYFLEFQWDKIDFTT